MSTGGRPYFSRQEEGWLDEAFSGVLDHVRASNDGVDGDGLRALCERHRLSTSSGANLAELRRLVENFLVLVDGRYKIACFYSDGKYLSSDGTRTVGWSRE